MKTHLVRIGNSRGVRLPKPLIAQAGLTEEVELRVQGGGHCYCPRHRPPLWLGRRRPENAAAQGRSTAGSTHSHAF